MKKIRKNKNKITILSLLLIVALLITGIIAYLTDTETVINRFTIGKVDITLTEPSWDALSDTNTNGIPDVAEAIEPGDNISKDPQINNIGNNPAYVYMKVSIPLGSYKSGDVTYSNAELFSLEGLNTTDWTELTAARSNDGNNNIYVYYYNNSLAEGTETQPTSTEPLFTSITFVSDISDSTTIISDSNEKQIVIDAYAIQSNNLPSGQNVTNNEMVTHLTTFTNPVVSGILNRTTSTTNTPELTEWWGTDSPSIEPGPNTNSITNAGDFAYEGESVKSLYYNKTINVARLVPAQVGTITVRIYNNSSNIVGRTDTASLRTSQVATINITQEMVSQGGYQVVPLSQELTIGANQFWTIQTAGDTGLFKYKSGVTAPEGYGMYNYLGTTTSVNVAHQAGYLSVDMGYIPTN